MLTFELNPNHDELTIHTDAEGLQELQKQLGFLLKGSSHVHMMTPAWGGNELTEDHQAENTTLLSKVTIFRWRDSPTTT
ncbi:MAG: immunity protein 32 [Acidobacteriia bacterium]|nr:immunity protein 32 [Terriglobia bacterium]